MEYHWGQPNYALKQEGETSEEDEEDEYEPEKPQVQIPRRTGKRGRPPSIMSKAAKRKGNLLLFKFIRTVLNSSFFFQQKRAMESCGNSSAIC